MKIFLFHRVHPARDPLWPALPPDRFQAQIRMIRRRYDVVPLEDYLLSGREWGGMRQPAAIVFDDGYRDFLDYALPVLAAEGLPASMYVVTDCADTGMPIWTYRLDNALQNTRRDSVGVDRGLLPPTIATRWTDGTGRLKFARAVKPALKGLEHAARERLLSQIFASLDDVPPPRGMMMDWNDLRQAAAEGVEIGSHTVSHPLLATMKDEAEIADELVQSRARIRAELGAPPRAIAYPNGSQDARVRRAAALAGYSLGLAVEHRPYRIGIDDPFAVPRIELYDEPDWKIRARMAGWIRTAKRIRNAIRL